MPIYEGETRRWLVQSKFDADPIAIKACLIRKGSADDSLWFYEKPHQGEGALVVLVALFASGEWESLVWENA